MLSLNSPFKSKATKGLFKPSAGDVRKQQREMAARQVADKAEKQAELNKKFKTKEKEAKETDLSMHAGKFPGPPARMPFANITNAGASNSNSNNHNSNKRPLPPNTPPAKKKKKQLRTPFSPLSMLHSPHAKKTMMKVQNLLLSPFSAKKPKRRKREGGQFHAAGPVSINFVGGMDVQEIE